MQVRAPSVFGFLAALALVACGPEVDAAAVLFREGSVRIEEGDYAAGVALLRQVLEEHPDSPIAEAVRQDWSYYEELLRIEEERLPSIAAADLMRLGRAIERHRSRRGGLPKTLDGLTPASIESIPRDPWGNPYLYQRERRGYTLETRGRDGEPGGEGQDGDIRVVNGRLRNAPRGAGR